MAISEAVFKELQPGDRIRIVKNFLGTTNQGGKKYFWDKFLGEVLTVKTTSDAFITCHESVEVSHGWDVSWPIDLIEEAIVVPAMFDTTCDCTELLFG